MLNGYDNENGNQKVYLAKITTTATTTTLHVQVIFCTFLCRCCCNVKLPSWTFQEGNASYVLTHTYKKTAACVPVHVSFFSFSLSFFYCRSFSRCWPLAFLIFSPPLQNFHVFLPTKFVSFVFYLQLQLSVPLLLPTFSFSLPFPIFQICENGKLSKLNTLDNTDTETISAFLFVRLWSAIDSCFTRREWPSDFPPNKPRVAVG